MEEQTLISRMKRGDLNSLERLVALYQTQAVHAAYLILYERALAEEVAQAAFVKVAERIQQFDERRPFAPWFFRIVINDALKVAKKQNRQVSLDALDEPAAELAHWLTDPSALPESLVEQKEMREIVLRAVQSLPPEQRAVVVMRYFLDLSEAEMSAKMERPLSTIKWWLRDARKRLAGMVNGLIE